MQESWAVVCRKPALHQQCSMRLLPATEVELPGQSAHTCAPAAALNFPGTHAAHADTTDAPARALAFPAKQAVHGSGPVLVLYVPCRHAVQAKPLGPVYPRLQMHPACAAVPDGDCVLAGHALHTPAAEYLPAEQSKQLARLPEPGIEDFPAMQSVHTAAPVAATYFPTSQSVHMALPEPVAYFPATHSVHSVAPA